MSTTPTDVDKEVESNARSSSVLAPWCKGSVMIDDTLVAVAAATDAFPAVVSHAKHGLRAQLTSRLYL